MGAGGEGSRRESGSLIKLLGWPTGRLNEIQWLFVPTCCSRCPLCADQSAEALLW